MFQAILVDWATNAAIVVLLPIVARAILSWTAERKKRIEVHDEWSNKILRREALGILETAVRSVEATFKKDLTKQNGMYSVSEVKTLQNKAFEQAISAAFAQNHNAYKILNEWGLDRVKSNIEEFVQKIKADEPASSGAVNAGGEKNSKSKIEN